MWQTHDTGERSPDLMRWGLISVLVQGSERRTETDQRGIGDRNDAPSFAKDIDACMPCRMSCVSPLRSSAGMRPYRDRGQSMQI